MVDATIIDTEEIILITGLTVIVRIETIPDLIHGMTAGTMKILVVAEIIVRRENAARMKDMAGSRMKVRVEWHLIHLQVAVPLINPELDQKLNLIIREVLIIVRKKAEIIHLLQVVEKTIRVLVKELLQMRETATAMVMQVILEGAGQ